MRTTITILIIIIITIIVITIITTIIIIIITTTWGSHCTPDEDQHRGVRASDRYVRSRPLSVTVGSDGRYRHLLHLLTHPTNALPTEAVVVPWSSSLHRK